MRKQYIVQSVGSVRGSRRVDEDDFWGDAVCEIIVDPAFSPELSLAGLSQFSHVEILFLFDRSVDSAFVPANRPRDRADLSMTGIFAQRRSLRPNSIGSTICRLVEVRPQSIIVAGLDALDGSPVVDIKPYMVEFAPRGSLRQPTWASEIMTKYFARHSSSKSFPAHWPKISTKRLRLRLQCEISAEEHFYYWQRNHHYFAETNPTFPPELLNLDHFIRQNIAHESLYDSGQEIRFSIVKPGQERIPIGSIIFSRIYRGAMNACYVGYTLDQSEQGNGYMTEALSAALSYMFQEQKLHRISASFVVGNDRSEKVLNRCGFQREGIARDYLFVQGAWRDHVMMSKITDVKNG
jgi:tRNA-Thr(GGU) m(6)t(6)A37 methyltransferase TsaA